MTGLVVRPIAATDREQWSRLYRGYRDFYAKPHRDEALDTVWGWLLDPQHETRGLIAESEDDLVGLAHYRSFARPLDASRGLFLDDLFTSPGARGTGVGTALLARLAEIAALDGASIVRWITAETNETARRLYDQVATRTAWVTYDLAPGDRAIGRS